MPTGGSDGASLEAPSSLTGAAVAALACPVCRGVLTDGGGSLRCAHGHTFDRARQGYVHLAATSIRHPGDTAPMVEARERVQAAGLFDPVTAALADAVPASARVVLEPGAGTAHHLSGVLTARPQAVGIAIDSAKPALRRAARAHPRLVAVAADVTEVLPVREGGVDAVVVVFAPRNADELARVLPSGGTLVVVTPTPAHLAEIAQPMGLLSVPGQKGAAVVDALVEGFVPVTAHQVVHQVPVTRALAADLAQMGPAGFHADTATLRERAQSLAEVTATTIAVTITVLHRR